MFEAIHIPQIIANALIAHAQTTPTYEVCGLLGGQIQQHHAHISAVQNIQNIATQPTQQYQFSPAEFVRTFYTWQKLQLAWVGIYHSHPTADLAPSVTDIAQAHYPHIAYLIIGEVHGNWQMKAWHIMNQQATILPIHIVE